jgi:PAS domain-containing protein
LVEDDIIISANPASARLLGLNSPHELLGEELTRLFIDENSKKSLHPSHQYAAF